MEQPAVRHKGPNIRCFNGSLKTHRGIESEVNKKVDQYQPLATLGIQEGRRAQEETKES